MSIKGYTKGLNNTALKQFVDNYTARMVTVAKQAGIESIRELRRAAVRGWYDSTASSSINNATHYEVKSVKQSADKIEIIIESYVDVDEYEANRVAASENSLFSSPYSSIVKWRERHEKNGWQYKGVKQPQMDDDIYSKSFSAIPMPYSIGEYMFNLPWEEGIVGLPPQERHTGTKWINPKPNKKRDPMKNHVEKYLKKKWKKTVTKKFAEMQQ